MGSPPSSSGLGSRPFKAEERVRIPLGARGKQIGSRGVARSNTPPCQGGDRRFKSGRDREPSRRREPKPPRRLAVPTGFEPAISALTGRRVGPGYTTGPYLFSACPQRDSNPCLRLERAR